MPRRPGLTVEAAHSKRARATVPPRLWRMRSPLPSIHRQKVQDSGENGDSTRVSGLKKSGPVREKSSGSGPDHQPRDSLYRRNSALVIPHVGSCGSIKGLPAFFRSLLKCSVSP